MWSFIVTAVKEIGESILSNRRRKRELEDAKHARRVEVVQQGRVNEATWNQKHVESSGWKDEYMTIVLSAPMILAFFPDMVPHIQAGFDALETMPDWYKAGVALMISAAFGYQRFVNWQMAKRYALPNDDPEI